MYKEISKCRICGNENLQRVVDLGCQYLTGVFPQSKSENLTKGPLRLVKCHGDGDVCGLLQLDCSYDLDEMYGENYGYRSGLNAGMVAHLHEKVKRIEASVELAPGDLVVDIGSNDGTTLRGYRDDLHLVGVDPTGNKFKDYYPPNVELIADFFSGDLLTRAYPGKKAKVITSFSMFYDLEAPLDFAEQVANALNEEGVWVFEQSYMPLMLERNAYDTICHEHLEYYGLSQIVWLAEKVGLKIIDVEFNDVNGGSFSVVAAHAQSRHTEATDKVQSILEQERKLGLLGLEPYLQFAKRIKKSRESVRSFLKTAREEGKSVYGLGASTKGNVLLQYCELGENDIVAIGEVNPDKYGCFTPGTWIPIEEEREIIARDAGYLLVLPWHFRNNFLANPAFQDMNLVFPLPELEVVTCKLCG